MRKQFAKYKSMYKTICIAMPEIYHLFKAISVRINTIVDALSYFQFHRFWKLAPEVEMPEQIVEDWHMMAIKMSRHITQHTMDMRDIFRLLYPICKS